MRTTPATNTMPPEGGKEHLRQQLYERLQELSFPAFSRCVCHTLEACGYAGLQVQRTGSKGKNTSGGWDLEGRLNAGVSSSRVLVQVKHSPKQEAVQCRCVDELRGATLRAGAMEGLLVTSGRFSPVAEQAADCPYPLVRLIDGERLAELMRRHMIGLQRAVIGSGDPARWVLDKSFFDALGHSAPASPGQPPAGVVVTIIMRPVLLG